jgi:hypothetical protein
MRVDQPHYNGEPEAKWPIAGMEDKNMHNYNLLPME